MGEEARSQEYLTDSDDDFFKCADPEKLEIEPTKVISKSCVAPDVHNLKKKSDQVFFEFFGMYTEESIKANKAANRR